MDSVASTSMPVPPVDGVQQAGPSTEAIAGLCRALQYLIPTAGSKAPGRRNVLKAFHKIREAASRCQSVPAEPLFRLCEVLENPGSVGIARDASCAALAVMDSAMLMVGTEPYRRDS